VIDMIRGVFARRFGAVLLAVMMALLGAASSARAHEASMAALLLKETEPGKFIGRWTLKPSDVDTRALRPIFPSHCVWQTPELVCGEKGLTGVLAFEGLGTKLSGVLVKVQSLDGEHSYTLAAGSPRATLATGANLGWAGWLDLAATYIDLGIEHILLGIDHLLFVLGLILLVDGTRRLIETITAFTVGHSISLAAATFGWIGVPEKPLNAAIALSIVFVGVEVVRRYRGEIGLTARFPWVVAFAFGLLHGIGFATALTALGIPQSTLPIALLFFNVGVEIGQIAFVLLVILLRWANRTEQVSFAVWTRPIPAYLIGSVAMFWFIGRAQMIFAG
jgi:hypothetical protein